MLVKAGYFDKAGNPCLKISLGGAFNPTGIEIEAIIDTGFTGFLSIPMIRAFPIGLPLYGTTSVTFADGSSGNKLTALGTVSVGTITHPGVIILEENSNDPLLGMDFLRTFNVALLMTQKEIALLDQTQLDALIKAQNAAKAKAPPAATIAGDQADDSTKAG